MAGASTKTHPDGGWGWCVVFGTFIATALGPGSFYASGVLFVAFLDAFGQSKAATSLVFTISGLVSVIMCSFGLAMSRRFGHRKTVMAAGVITFSGYLATSFTTSLYQIYITYAIAACGSGLSLVTSIEMVGLYFKHRLPLAIGLAMAGSGAGQFVLSIVTQLMVDRYGWRGTVMILAAMSANLCVAGALLRPLNNTQTKPKQYESISSNGILESIEMDTLNRQTRHVITRNSEIGVQNGERSAQKKLGCVHSIKLFLQSLYDASLFKEPVFYLILLTGVFHAVGQTIVIIHMVKGALEFRLSSTLSSFIPALMGLSQLTARPLWGALGNSDKLAKYALYAFCMAVCGISSIISNYTKSFTAQLLYIVVFGFCFGGYIILIPVVVTHFLGAKRMGYGITCVIQGQGVTALFIGPLAGWMRDSSGAYDSSFWLCGIAFLIAAIIALFLPVVDKMVMKRRKTSVSKRKTFRAGLSINLRISEFMTTV